jgi:cytoskeletal protein RodZ
MTAPSKKATGSTTNIYRAARLRKSISLVKAVDDTHIRRSVLQAIESDQTDHLPTVYVAGLRSSYGRYLGLDERVQTKPDKASRHHQPAAGHFERLRNRPVITSALLLRLVLAFIAVLAAGYAGLQVYRFFAAPQLTLVAPAETELLIRESSLEVSGKTSSGVNIFVNQQAVPLGTDGSFQTRVTLRSGLNDIEVRAVNALGKIATRRITAVFIPNESR